MRKSVYTSFFTLLAFWIVASFAQAAQIVTEIKDGAKVYIRYNAGTDEAPVYYYMNAIGQKNGSKDFGTPLVTDYHGVEFTLYENGKDGDNTIYALHASMSNKGGTNNESRYVVWDSRFKTDKKKTEGKGSNFVFIPVEGKQNVFNIKIKVSGQDNYVVPNSTLGNYVTINLKTSKEWEVVTKEQLIQELNGATSSNPVDATFFISAYGFGHNVDIDLKKEWKIIIIRSKIQLFPGLTRPMRCA